MGEIEGIERFVIILLKFFYFFFGEYIFVSICRVSIVIKVVVELSLYVDFDDVCWVCDCYG